MPSAVYSRKLWLGDAEPSDLRKSIFLRSRIEACKQFRYNAPNKRRRV